MPKEIWVITACILAIVATMYAFTRKKYTKIVKEHSRRLKELQSLNQRTMFYGGEQKQFVYHQACQNKRQFDHMELEDYLIALLDENQGELAERLYQIDCNQKYYAAYLRECQLLVPMVTAEECARLQIPYKAFLCTEKRLFKKGMLKKPLLEISVSCKASYTSPQGKNYYEKEHTYGYAELKSYLERLGELRATRRTRQYQIKMERAKMTDSLRYDIMRRDKFRCQLCGSTAADGVKLHVDHILPVAKGGKTTPENLRTLCDRCNLGKSDKYE